MVTHPGNFNGGNVCLASFVQKLDSKKVRVRTAFVYLDSHIFAWILAWDSVIIHTYKYKCKYSHFVTANTIDLMAFLFVSVFVLTVYTPRPGQPPCSEAAHFCWGEPSSGRWESIRKNPSCRRLTCL